jgi:hypothetical protein
LSPIAPIPARTRFSGLWAGGSSFLFFMALNGLGQFGTMQYQDIKPLQEQCSDLAPRVKTIIQIPDHFTETKLYLEQKGISPAKQ